LASWVSQALRGDRGGPAGRLRGCACRAARRRGMWPTAPLVVAMLACRCGCACRAARPGGARPAAGV